MKATVNAAIEPAIAQSVAVSAMKLAPPSMVPSASTKLREMDDKQLRLELLRAKGEGEEFRARKIIAEFKRRENAASSIETGSRDE